MKESDIRPKEIFDKYIELSRLDGERLDRSKFTLISCCACNSSDTKFKFSKNNYSYNLCNNCGSLFCSPRPTLAQLSELYFKSESSQYWSQVFFPSVESARREKMFRPKAQKVADLISKKNLRIQNVCDVGAGHGIFLEELRSFASELKLFALEPDSTSAERCRNKGIEVMQKVSEEAEGWEDKFDLVISSEVIEHVFSPLDFISSLFRLTKPGGYSLITGLGYEGFDVLTLQENSKSVAAPHHLNFMSVKGFETLFLRTGFKEVEVWTPGLLDVDIVINSGVDNEFIRALKMRGEDMVRKFQTFLAENKLSSHVWVMAKK